MNTSSRIGYVFLVMLFLMSAMCFLYLNVYSWAIYPAGAFTVMFVGRLFLSIKNSGVDPALKKDIYMLTGLLITVVISNILWVFFFPWCKYIASGSSLVFVYVLFTKLRDGNIRKKIKDNQLNS